jgi:hypothetical protein
MAVPWKEIIIVLPGLITAAGSLFKKAEEPPKSLPAVPQGNSQAQLDAVIKRLEYFESLESEQAQLLKQTIEQLQNVTVASSLIAKRANVALVLAGVSVVVAAIAIFIR